MAVHGRRRFLLQALGAVSAAACSGGGSGAGGAGSGACSSAASGPGLNYCLVQKQELRVYGAAKLAAGQVVVMLLDDSTGAIVARDEAGFYAMSATCTHACCNVSACGASSCSAPVLTGAACSTPTPVSLPLKGQAAFLCPCHGSRYAADGTVLNGPAAKRLPAVALRIDGQDVLVDMSTPADPSMRVAG